MSKREYPRLHRGVVLYGPADEPGAKPFSCTNLNTASAKELSAAISGVGTATAKDIVAHRKKQPFASLAECAERVGGVSLEQLEAADVTV